MGDKFEATDWRRRGGLVKKFGRDLSKHLWQRQRQVNVRLGQDEVDGWVRAGRNKVLEVGGGCRWR